MLSVSRMEMQKQMGPKCTCVPPLCIEHLVRVGLLLALTRAHGHLSLLGLLNNVVVRDIKAKLALHLADLLDSELRHLVGDLERPFALDVSLGEDDINLLQITASSLWVEEVGEGESSEVDKGEEQVHTPRTAGREKGSEHDNGEVANPVGTSGGRTSHSTGTERVDLGRVNPGQRQGGEGEETDEEEDTNDGTLSGPITTGSQTGHGDDETATLACETDQEQVTTTNVLNHEE